MPDVRLSGDFKGHKRGEVVRLTNAQLSEADAARVVGKLFPTDYPDAKPIREAAKKAPAKKAAAKAEKAEPREDRPPLDSFGSK
jgi:hypothetical protein